MIQLMKSFWQELPTPFFALAPMEDVTDSVFRQIVASCARPDVFFTEFTSVEGLRSRGKDKIMRRFQFTKIEQPIIAQIWGMNPENYFEVAQLIVKMGFAGIDINMGCPERVVLKQGACAGLINNRPLVSEIIKATQAGAGNLPVSVKTRIGLHTIVTEDWIPFLLSHNLDALTIHGRTVKEMSDVPCHWDEIKKAVAIRNKLGVQTKIVGNGDVSDYQDGLRKVKEYEVDAVMIGRGIFKNLWAFSQKPQEPKSLEEMLRLLLRHAQLYTQTWGNRKNFLVLRRFFKIYVSGFAGAGNLREQLMTTQRLADVEKIIADYKYRSL